jgi:hypothetical protein
VQVTRWETERINSHVREFSCGLIRLLATTGDDAYISEHSWRLILSVHTQPETKDDKAGWERHGIVWNLDSPVSSRLLSYVKDPSEEVEQTLLFHNIVRQFMVLLEGSLNKGFASQNSELGQLPKIMSDTMTSQSTIIERADSGKSNASVTGGQQWN